MTVKRFDCTTAGYPDEGEYGTMEEEKHGQYVLYDDYAAVHDALTLILPLSLRDACGG